MSINEKTKRMKKFKVPVILGIIFLILFLADLRFNLFDMLTVQFSKDKYIEYVSEFDYEKDLEKEPICIKDMASDSEELSKTELSKIVTASEIHQELEKKYDLSAVVTANTDFEKVLQILDWLTEHTYYSGAQGRMLTDNSLDILDYSFDKPFTRAINCRYKAIVFADCLVAVGIKAFPVAMVSSGFSGSHFTCMVYISELDKWCSFDPSFGCWFSDEDKNPIDIFEIRELFLQGDEPVVNGYNFNGTQECFDVYLNGFMKYCISNLSTWADNSMDRRTEKSYSDRKEFNSVIPIDN